MDTAMGKPVATKEESGNVDLSESETGSEKDMWQGNRFAYETATGKPYASSKSDCQGGPKAERIEWSHNLHVSPATIHHTEAVSSIVRRIYGREHDDTREDLDVNMAMWGIFLSATLRAAVHLGQDCEANLRFVKNHHWCKHNSFYRFYAEVDKLIVQKGLSNHQRQSLRLLRFCALCEKIEIIPFQPGRAK